MYAKVIAIDTTKGGVGKTTTTAALMECLSHEQHRRVLAIDLDGQATLSRYYGIDQADPAMADVLEGRVEIGAITRDLGAGLHIAPASGALFRYEYGESGDEALRHALSRIRRQYDIILLDCPPAAGPVVQNALVAADLILMPVQPSALDIYGLDEFLRTLGELHRSGKNPDVQIAGVLLVQYHGRYTLDRNMRQTLVDYGLPVLDQTIPQAQAVREAVLNKRSIITHAAQHPAAQAYREVAHALIV